MNIGIDITPLQTGHKDRGIGVYTNLLIESLQKYEKKHSYYFFTRGQKVPKDVELIHYPYFDPFFITLPLFYHKPTVVTVHDLIPLAFPDHFSAGIRGNLKWLIQRWSLSRSNRIIVDSKTSKRDVEHIAAIPADTIDVIYLAPSPIFRLIRNTALLYSMKAKYNLPKTFILFVGDVNWNKNVLGMLRAYQKLKAQNSKLKATAENSKLRELKLVFVGKAFFEGSKEASEIIRYINDESLGDDVIKIGGVPTEDLVAIYNLASVYLQPSFYEGFGLPVLEAMACGLAVVSSRAASLAEISCPAIAVDPMDPNDIARGVMEALTLTPVKRSALLHAQTKWIQQYSWERVVRQTILSYEKAAV